jgi:hypothetical protein
MMDPDDAVPYNEFIDLARDHGLLGIEVQVLQTPGEANGNAAVVRATARTAQGSFEAVGEAAPDSAPAAWRPFLTTLAELRAKARALRELTGADHAVREELTTPYGPRGEEDEFPPTPIVRPTPAYNSPARAQAPQAGPAARPSVAQTPPVPASTARDDEDEDADEAAAEVDEDEPDEVVPRGQAAAAAVPPPDDELPPDFEGIGREMEAKLLKLAISIAALEGSDISEAEAREKLDAFFLKAFKHPLNRASRLEGQRVVQRLSSDLSQRRSEASRAGGDE